MSVFLLFAFPVQILINFFKKYARRTNLVEFNTKLAAAFDGRRKGVQILPPESKEFLDAQAAQGVVSCVTDAVLLPHRHDLVIHVQRVLRKQITRLKYEPNIRT